MWEMQRAQKGSHADKSRVDAKLLEEWRFVGIDALQLPQEGIDLVRERLVKLGLQPSGYHYPEILKQADDSHEFKSFLLRKQAHERKKHEEAEKDEL